MAEHHDARGGDGKFTRTPDTAERDAEAARLRARGLTYRAIAAEMGYASGSSAYDAVQRCLASVVEEPAKEVQQLELERLDDMLLQVNAVAAGAEDGELKLKAVDRLLKIMERRARLLGLDSPIKADVGGRLTYEILGVDLAALK